MPLTAEQIVALQLLADADPKEVADGLQEHAPAARQHVFRIGYGTHKGESKTELDALKEQVTTLTQERDDAKAQADTLGSKDADFAAEKTRLEKLAADAKEEAKTAKATADERVKGLHKSREKSALQAKLVAAGVDPDYAEQVLVPKLADRIRVDGLTDDGGATVAYLDPDGVPDASGLDGLAAQAVKTVDARWIVSGADSGSGASGNSNANGGGYDPVKAGKEAAAASKAEPTSNAFR